MSFVDLIRQILRTHPEGMTPQQIRETIKVNYSDFYATESHRRNVERAHYKDVDHALLAQIYVASRTAGQIVVDKTQKPIRLTLTAGQGDDVSIPDEEIDTENLERLEAGVMPHEVMMPEPLSKPKPHIRVCWQVGTVRELPAPRGLAGPPLSQSVPREQED